MVGKGNFAKRLSTPCRLYKLRFFYMNETNIYQLRFLLVPDWAYKDNSLSGLDLKLLAFIYSFKGDKFFFGNEHLGAMFNVSAKGISKSILKLQKKGYIRLNYSTKSGGGKIRFITRLVLQYHSDGYYSNIQNDTTVSSNGNNIKGNNTKVGKKTLCQKTIAYLQDIPVEDKKELTEKYRCDNSQLDSKADDLINYCEAHGKGYKSPKAFLRNALKRDFGLRDTKSMLSGIKFDRPPI